MSQMFPTLPRPGQATPPPSGDWVALLARQLFEEMTTEHRRGLGFAALRQVEIAAVDTATSTATVILGGDTDNPIVDVKALPGYVPKAGDVPWAHQNGSDLLLVGAPGYTLPQVKVRKGATSSVASGDNNAYIDFGATPTFYGGDRYGMYDAVNSRFVFPWTGSYLIEYHGRWTGAVGGRRIAEFEDQDGFIRVSDRMEWDTSDTALKDYVSNPARVHQFLAGQWVRVKVFQSSGGPLTIADDTFSNVAAITYQS